MRPILRVLSSLLTTVQDQGRPALQRYGVPVAGAMDLFASTIANRLVGNPISAAVLEISAGGTAFEILQPALLALTGANLGAYIDDQPFPLWTAVSVRPCSQLVLRGRPGSWGARAYLALAGGIAVPEVLGSRSTCLSGSFGGFAGRALRPADLIEGGVPEQDLYRLAGIRWPASMRPAYCEHPTLRVLAGPHTDLFEEAALSRLLTGSFQLSANSNRMGYRLQGAQLHYVHPVSLPSLGVIPGALQVPPDGTPILLMADAQPTGGYPIIAVVIGADLPLAAQLLPGDHLHFSRTTIEVACSAQQTHQRWIEAPLPEDDDFQMLAWAGANG